LHVLVFFFVLCFSFLSGQNSYSVNHQANPASLRYEFDVSLRL
jgi:hypothetical protein